MAKLAIKSYNNTPFGGLYSVFNRFSASGYSMHFTGGLPDNCAPIYVAKDKSLTRRRGSPAKAKTENLELQVY